MKGEIIQTWFFRQEPAEVWEYLTRPELLEQWLGKTDIRPVVGHKFRFVSPHGNDALCEVLEVVPFTRLAFSWQKRSVKDDRVYVSRVEWTLVGRADGTELRLVHNGFTHLEDVAGHENGWKECVRKFERLIAGDVQNIP